MRDKSLRLQQGYIPDGGCDDSVWTKLQEIVPAQVLNNIPKQGQQPAALAEISALMWIEMCGHVLGTAAYNLLHEHKASPWVDCQGNRHKAQQQQLVDCGSDDGEDSDDDTDDELTMKNNTQLAEIRLDRLREMWLLRLISQDLKNDTLRQTTNNDLKIKRKQVDDLCKKQTPTKIENFAKELQYEFAHVPPRAPAIQVPGGAAGKPGAAAAAAGEKPASAEASKPVAPPPAVPAAPAPAGEGSPATNGAATAAGVQISADVPLNGLVFVDKEGKRKAVVTLSDEKPPQSEPASKPKPVFGDGSLAVTHYLPWGKDDQRYKHPAPSRAPPPQARDRDPRGGDPHRERDRDDRFGLGGECRRPHYPPTGMLEERERDRLEYAMRSRMMGRFRPGEMPEEFVETLDPDMRHNFMMMMMARGGGREHLKRSWGMAADMCGPDHDELRYRMAMHHGGQMPPGMSHHMEMMMRYHRFKQHEGHGGRRWNCQPRDEDDVDDMDDDDRRSNDTHRMDEDDPIHNHGRPGGKFASRVAARAAAMPAPPAPPPPPPPVHVVVPSTDLPVRLRVRHGQPLEQDCGSDAASASSRNNAARMGDLEEMEEEMRKQEEAEAQAAIQAVQIQVASALPELEFLPPPPPPPQLAVGHHDRHGAENWREQSRTECDDDDDEDEDEGDGSGSDSSNRAQVNFCQGSRINSRQPVELPMSEVIQVRHLEPSGCRSPAVIVQELDKMNIDVCPNSSSNLKAAAATMMVDDVPAFTQATDTGSNSQTQTQTAANLKLAEEEEANRQLILQMMKDDDDSLRMMVISVMNCTPEQADIVFVKAKRIAQTEGRSYQEIITNGLMKEQREAEAKLDQLRRREQREKREAAEMFSNGWYDDDPTMLDKYYDC